MTNHEVILGLRGSTKCSWWNFVKIFKRNFNYKMSLLKQDQNGNTMVITYEHGVLTRFLKLDSLELTLVQFPWILELYIINYEIITNYQRLTKKSTVNNWIKLFYNFISENMFEFKLWKSIYNLIELDQVSTNFKSLNLIWNLNWIKQNRQYEMVLLHLASSTRAARAIRPFGPWLEQNRGAFPPWYPAARPAKSG
jgi:hypothetical protein